jgi:ribosome-associated protein
MEDIRVRGVVIPAEEIRLRFSRSGGPGGQNVNKRATKVAALFDVTASRSLTPRQKERLKRALSASLEGRGVLRVVAQEERTQAANRELALARLARLLARGLRPPPPPRRPTRPTAAAAERRIAQKKRRAEIKRGRAARSDE